MISLKDELCKRDLCGISEYLRDLRASIKEQDLRMMLKRASALHIHRDVIHHSIDNFFRTEAGKLLNRAVELGASLA